MALVLILCVAVVKAGDGSAVISDGTISGHVYDSDTKKPLSQAFVYCQELKFSKPVTNRTGYYTIEHCFSPLSNYTIKCSKNGYQTLSKIIEMDINGEDNVDFNLMSNAAASKEEENGSIKAAIKGIISGQIINAASRAIVPRAKIAIRDSSGYIYPGMADNNGYFISSPIFSPSKAYDVICDTFGYLPNHQNVMTDVSGNAIANIAISQEFEVNPESCSKYGGNWQNGECIFVH